MQFYIRTTRVNSGSFEIKLSYDIANGMFRLVDTFCTTVSASHFTGHCDSFEDRSFNASTGQGSSDGLMPHGHQHICKHQADLIRSVSSSSNTPMWCFRDKRILRAIHWGTAYQTCLSCTWCIYYTVTQSQSGCESRPPVLCCSHFFR